MIKSKEILYNAKLNWWLTSINAKALRLSLLLACIFVYAEILLPLYPIDNSVFPISIIGLGGYLVSHALALQFLYVFALKKGVFQRYAITAKYSLICLAFIGLIPAFQATLASLCIPVLVATYLSADKLPLFRKQLDVLASVAPGRITFPDQKIQADSAVLSAIEISETPAGHEVLQFKFADGRKAKIILAQQFSLQPELTNMFPELVKKTPQITL